MQHLDANLAFLQEKIKDIKIALFKSEMNSELQLPNNIIETLKVEDEGFVWFLTSCSGDYAKNIDKSFYAYLDYYKKGTDCRIRLSGKAMIVEDDKGDFITVSNYSKSTSTRLVLVKMKIMQAEYIENRPLQNNTWKEKLVGAFNHIFFPDAHRIYDFN
ncbi:MAG: pyridoxamine 5'-phosphate oxidase family protein [Bacteroidetes bacterium]|nr:pyridoxamine 5'-phosphate oxidase family protein [Bacteroidota bacterium]MBS1758316.1 pyridoxamine 5'-phosphate oxidase family protein [Bacteroidota bacterium]